VKIVTGAHRAHLADKANAIVVNIGPAKEAELDDEPVCLFYPSRNGDIVDSVADVTEMTGKSDWKAETVLSVGLARTIAWYGWCRPGSRQEISQSGVLVQEAEDGVRPLHEFGVAGRHHNGIDPKGLKRDSAAASPRARS
jgi:hypothetical protein